MITRRQANAGLLASLSTALLGAASARAQDAYPTTQIKSMCMFPAGSGADVAVRYYSRKLQDLCGKPVIVENKVGAFGNIATEAVAKSKPDGYTIYIAPTSSVLATAAHLFKKLNFDPVKDFDHICTLCSLPFLLAVAGNSPYKTVTDLVAHLKDKGDKASYGSVANTGLVSSELFKQNFGLQTVEVKYRNAGDALNDLLGGQLVFVHIDPTTWLGQLQGGQVRALANTAAKRSKALPNIPSAHEAGIMNSDLTAWWSVHVPAGTPKPVMDRLTGWFQQITADPETVKFLTDVGWDPMPGDADTVRQMLARDLQKWGEYVRLAKIEQL